MPIPVLGAVGLVGKLFGGVFKKIRANRQVRKAEKAQKKAETLAAKSVMQLQTVGNKLFNVNETLKTEAQNTVFPEAVNSTFTESQFAANKTPGQMNGLLKYWPYLAGLIVVLLLIFKRK